jgi:hypothetical protein
MKENMSANDMAETAELPAIQPEGRSVRWVAWWAVWWLRGYTSRVRVWWTIRQIRKEK